MALGRNIIANYVGQGLRASLGILLVPVYIEYLGIESYGLIGIFGVLQAWLSLLDLGLKPALSREMARFSGGAHSAEWIRDLLRTIEIIGFSVAALVAVGLAVASPWLAENWVTSKTLSTDTVVLSFRVMGLVTALRFVENIYTSSLVGLQRQVLENAVSSVAAVVRGLGAIAVLHWGSRTVSAFFAWQAVVSVVTVFALAWGVYRQLPKTERSARFSRASLEGIWRFASGILVLTLQSLLLTNLDKLVLSKVLTLEQLGHYVLAGVAANSLGMLSQPVASALTPRFTELATKGAQRELADAYHFGSQTVAVLAGSAAVVLITFSERVLILWTKKPELAGPVAPLMAVLVLGSLFNGLMYVPYQLQLAHGWTRLTTIFNAVLIVIVVPTLFLVAPSKGAAGAAALWAGINASYLLIAIPIMHRRLLPDSMWQWYLRDTLRPIAVAVVVCQLWRLTLAPTGGRFTELLAIGLISTTTLAAAAVTAPGFGARILSRLRPARPAG